MQTKTASFPSLVNMLSDRRKSLTIFDCHKSPKLSRSDKRRGSFASTLVPPQAEDKKNKEDRKNNNATTSSGAAGKNKSSRNLISLSTDRRASFGAPSDGLGPAGYKNERRGSYNPPHSGPLIDPSKTERRGSLVQR